MRHTGFYGCPHSSSASKAPELPDDKLGEGLTTQVPATRSAPGMGGKRTFGLRRGQFASQRAHPVRMFN